jgi:hypothetical protein
MAWSVVAAKLEGHPTLEVSADMQMRIPTQDIFPMTALSRVIYALRFQGSENSKIESARNLLKHYHMDDAPPWAALRWLLAILLLAGLTMAAWPRSQPR